MLNVFRVSSIIEGISYLVILCVSLNIISREFVFTIGMTHGVLFLVYFLMSLLASHKQGWSVITWVLVLMAAVVPFAFIPVEIFIRRELSKVKVASTEQ